MLKTDRPVILLPSYNEERAIGQTIDEVQRFSPESVIVVVDSNSQDSTREIAHSKGTAVLNVEQRGKGLAVRYALSKIQAPYFCILDSDNTYPAQYIPDILESLKNGTDVVIAERATILPEAMTEINKIGNYLLSLMAEVIYNQHIKDVCTGMWGFKKKALDKFKLTSNGFTLEADFFINACRADCVIKRLPIHYRPRLEGDRPKLRVRNGLEIGWFLIKKRFG